MMARSELLWMVCAVFVGHHILTGNAASVSNNLVDRNLQTRSLGEPLWESRIVRPTGRPLLEERVDLDPEELNITGGARSVHLWWDTKAALGHNNITEIKADIVVDVSVPGTYVCGVGFDGAYMGIQELVQGNDLGQKKVFLFSVWDGSPTEKVKLVEKGPGVISRRFSGEGEGQQSFLIYDWKIGEVCHCMVQATRSGATTRYTGWFKGSTGDWMHVATYEVVVEGRLIRGVYSFVQDFIRNTDAQQALFRRARFAIESRSSDQNPKRIRQATFSADKTNATNINAGVEGPWIFLETGGKIQQKVPLGAKLKAD